MPAQPIPDDPSRAAPGRRLIRDPDLRRLWVAGLAISMVRWLEILVFGIFAYQATASAFVVASLTMLRLLPLAVFGLPFGALAVRIDRRSGLLVVLATLAASTSVLLALAATGRIAVWHLAVASIVNGIAWAADNPFRRGLIGDLAGPTRMGSAMAVDVGGSNASRLVGPGLGGLLLAYGSLSAVFTFTALLYGVALLTVLGLRRRPPPATAGRPALRAMLASGFIAARASPLMAGTLWVTLVYNLFGWPVMSLMPVIGKDRLGLAPDGVGALVSVEGVGTIIGALALAVFARPAIYGRIYASGAIVFMAMLPLIALSVHVATAAAAMLVLGIGQSGYSVMQSTLVFVSAPAERRLPAMGLLTVCIGIGPLGFLAVGWFAERAGAAAAAIVFPALGLLTLAASWPWWRVCWRIRPPEPDPSSDPTPSASRQIAG